jgi:hypothetical protein
MLQAAGESESGAATSLLREATAAASTKRVTSVVFMVLSSGHSFRRAVVWRGCRGVREKGEEKLERCTGAQRLGSTHRLVIINPFVVVFVCDCFGRKEVNE